MHEMQIENDKRHEEDHQLKSLNTSMVKPVETHETRFPKSPSN